MQGEGGYVVPPADFLPRLRALCDAHGILLVFDEVQTGMGRTGRMFAAEHFGVVPDVMVLAKGIASGMPLGAMMAKKELMNWPAGTHGSTIAGNPVCIAAAHGDDRSARGRAGREFGARRRAAQERADGEPGRASRRSRRCAAWAS